MKKTIGVLIPLLLTCVAAVSCKKTEVFKRDVDSMTCDCREQILYGYVCSDAQWEIESDVDWITPADPSSGFATGNGYVKYNVLVAYNEGEQRTGTFFLVKSDKRLPVTVTQGESNFSYGEVSFSGLLKQANESTGFVVISYNNASGKETADVTCKITGKGTGLSVAPQTFTLSPGNGKLSVPVIGVPVDFGDVQFELSVNGKVMGSVTVTIKEDIIRYFYLVLDENKYEMKESSYGVWEVEVDAPASGNFILECDGKAVGFTSFAGAGGLGTVLNKQCSLPYFKFTGKHNFWFYSVAKAIGQCSAISDGGNEFWLNMDSDGRIRVSYDETYGTDGSYYLEAINEDDSVVFNEQFDLFTFGGDPILYLGGAIYGDSPETYDGIAPAVSFDGTWTSTGSKGNMWDFPVSVASIVPCKSYIRNRGVEDWEFARVEERPGAIQLNNGSNYDSYLITPNLSNISGTRDITLYLEIARYSSTSKSDIYVDLLGAGEFVSCHAEQTAGQDKDGVKVEAKSGDYTGLSGSRFTIDTEFCMTAGSSFNTSIYKPRSYFTFKISGATNATKIKINAPYKSGNPPRCIVFGIKVTVN